MLDCNDGSLIDIVAPPTPDSDCNCDGNDITYAGQASECTGVVPNERLNSVLSKILTKLCGIDTEVDVSGLTYDCFAVAPTGLTDVSDMLQYIFDNSVFKTGATCDCPVTGDVNFESGNGIAGCDGGSVIFGDDYTVIDSDVQTRIESDLKTTGGFGAGYQGVTGNLDLSLTSTAQFNYTYGLDANGSNRTVTLPQIANSDHATRRLTLTRVDCTAFTITINAYSGETVNGASSLDLPAGHSYILQADETSNWVIVAEYYGCAMVAQSDGDIYIAYNLGVGDSSPDAKLDVSQSDVNSVTAIFENQGAAAADLVRVVRNATTVDVIDEAGRLHVGGSNPSAMLHVTGENTSSGTYAFLVENSAGTDSMWVLNNGGAVIRPLVNKRFVFSTAGDLSITDDSGIIRSFKLTSDVLTFDYTHLATSNLNLSPASASGARFFYIDGTSTAALGINDVVWFELAPTYNLTAAATGNTYGFRYDPTFTSTGGTNYGVVVDDNTVKNGFGTLTPNSTLQSGGSFGARIRTQVGSGSVGATDHTVLVDSSGGATAITLPNVATCSGRIVYIKKISSDGNTITISGDGNIDGAVSATLTNQNKAYGLQCDGSAWWVINEVD